MRLFFAIELAPAVTAAAAGLIDELRTRAARMAPRSRLTWVPAERLHLTVRFIGPADDAVAGAVQEAMAADLDVPPFAIAFSGVGAFPSGGQPRVIWTGVSEGFRQLVGTEGRITERLKMLGIPSDPRPYSPHLTLARVRDAAGLRSSALFSGLEHRSLGASIVHAITLFESRLSSKGPTYVPLLRTRLTGGVSPGETQIG